MTKIKTITEDELGKQLEENQEYKYGFTTDVDSEVIPIGLNEDVVRLISSSKISEVNDSLKCGAVG